MHFIFEIFQYPFVQKALCASVLASIICGVVGTYIVVKRLVFLSSGLSHTSLGGVGIAYYYGVNPFFGACCYSLLSALTLSFLRSQGKNEDTIMGILWPFSMSLGIVCVSSSPFYSENLWLYLFGNILMVSAKDLVIMFVFIVICLLIVFLCFPHFQAICFDEDFIKVRGVRSNFFYTLLLVLISLSVLVLMKVIGVLLLISLLAIPPAISRKFATSIKGMMLGGTLFSFFFMIGGLSLSYCFDCSAGAMIVFLACFLYIVADICWK